MSTAKMAKFDSYQAVADEKLAKALFNTTSPFTIDVRFLGGLTETQKNAFKAAADRWSRVIIGDLPSVNVDGEVIDDVLILAQGVDIDGPGRILGQAGPTRLRPGNAGQHAFIPARGTMSFDTADLALMEQRGTLVDVITHEMGHVLGIGTIWTFKSLIKGVGKKNPTFVGAKAKIQYGKLRGTGPTRVPVENTGGPGTRDGHWRETVFRNELMSGFIAAPNNPISAMTVASLQDLGYEVDVNAAEPYTLPNLLQLAESGLLLSLSSSSDEGIMLPNIPIVLPEDSLQ
jgi:Leishmanolysin